MLCEIIGERLFSDQASFVEVSNVFSLPRDTWITEDDFRQIRDAGLSECCGITHFRYQLLNSFAIQITSGCLSDFGLSM